MRASTSLGTRSRPRRRTDRAGAAGDDPRVSELVRQRLLRRDQAGTRQRRGRIWNRYLAVRDQLGTEVLGGGTECVLSELRHDFRGKEFESFADMRGGAAEEPIVMRTLCWRELDSKFQFLGTFGSLTDLGDTRAAQRWKHCTKQKVRRRCAGGKWIRIFCSAGGFEASMFVLGRNLAFHRSSGSADRRRHRHQRGRLHSMAEADDCADDTATPTVDRPQLGRSLETAAYLARNRKTLWGGRRGRGNFVAACNRWSAAMPQPNDLSSSLVALDQNSTIMAVVELSQSSCGRAPPAWVTWQVAVAREQ